MSNKQTAVEWLREEMNKIDYDTRFLTFEEFNNERLKLWEQAKQMEKEQIIDSFRNGLDDFYDKDTFYYENGEKYYNETYKQQDK
jgi:hypothetical protein